MLQGQDRIRMITTFLTGRFVSSVILCSLARNQRRSLSLVVMTILTPALMKARRKMKGTRRDGLMVILRLEKCRRMSLM